MSQLYHFNNLGSARFVTFSCYHNYNLFKTSETKDIFVKRLSDMRGKYNYKLYGYVVMPNHVHLVMLPTKETTIGQIIGTLKSITAREIINLWKDKELPIFEKLKVHRDGKERFAFWQRRYYDHNCRSKDTVIEKINYCHNNPIKKRLVTEPGEWKWSSYRWYNGKKDSLIELDDVGYVLIT